MKARIFINDDWYEEELNDYDGAEVIEYLKKGDVLHVCMGYLYKFGECQQIRVFTDNNIEIGSWKKDRGWKDLEDLISIVTASQK